MGAFYEEILEKIKTHGFRLTRERIRLSKWEKFLALRLVLAQRAPGVAAVPLPPRRLLVIGAGVAGIAAAAEATLNGDTVTLLDARPAPGGRAGCIPGVAGGPEVDCGHHAMFGCYRAFLQLAETLGVREKLTEAPRLDIPYRSPGGRTSRLRAALLPAPLHLAGALAGFAELSLGDRFSISRFALALRLGSARPLPGETAAAWLARNGQTPGAVRALWEPFCVAALNEPLAAGCATLLETTLRRTLFGAAGDSAILSATDALGRLFDPELALYLGAVGGELRLKTRAQALLFAGSGTAADAGSGGSIATGVVLADGSTLAADAVICAVPWAELPRLLPPGDPLAAQAAQLSGNPILNIHLFTKSPLMPESFAALLDSPVQWVFREGDGAGSAAADGAATAGNAGKRGVDASAGARLHHYALTLSCPGDWMNLPNAEILLRAKTELLRFFPDAQNVDIADARVCKYPAATFSAVPGAEAFRPGARTHWQNVFLAGDWTATGLPATLESAAQSGQAAAQLGALVAT
jgi:squalene-associated FAD-dependent desaturase